MTKKTNSQLIKHIWEAVYNPKIKTDEAIKLYFHEDYEQSVNQVSMNRDQYIQHVMEQKKNMTIDHIEYARLLEEGDELFAVYYPKGKNSKGGGDLNLLLL